MENSRIGETEFSVAGDRPLAYGIHGIQAAANFFDQEGSTYFGELEEALMQGVVGNANDGDKKPFLSSRPPTLEIFPSWPMRFQHTSRSMQGNSQSADSTDSGSAQNTTLSPPLDSDSPVSLKAIPEKPPEQKQQVDMASDAPKTGATVTNQQLRPQERVSAEESPYKLGTVLLLLESQIPTNHTVEAVDFSYHCRQL